MYLSIAITYISCIIRLRVTNKEVNKLGETSLYIEENGRMLLYKKVNRYDMKLMQDISIREFGKPNKIKYKQINNRVLLYDDRNIHIIFDDTIGY